MVWLTQDAHLPSWSWRLRERLGSFMDPLRSVPEITDVNGLSDRQLKDIGVKTTDRAVAFDREMAGLCRKGLRPFA